jgi:hypothetical protein
MSREAFKFLLFSWGFLVSILLTLDTLYIDRSKLIKTLKVVLMTLLCFFQASCNFGLLNIGGNSNVSSLHISYLIVLFGFLIFATVFQSKIRGVINNDTFNRALTVFLVSCFYYSYSFIMR